MPPGIWPENSILTLKAKMNASIIAREMARTSMVWSFAGLAILTVGCPCTPLLECHMKESLVLLATAYTAFLSSGNFIF